MVTQANLKKWKGSSFDGPMQFQLLQKRSGNKVTVLLQNEESAQSITQVGCIFLWETLLLQLKFDDDVMIFLTGISTFLRHIDM